MTTTFTEEEVKAKLAAIENMSHFELCRIWRFAPIGDPLMDTTFPFAAAISDRLFGHFGGFTPAISKALSP